MQWPSFSVIVSGVFAAYLAHSMYTIYGLFYPEVCTLKTRQCLKPYIAKNPELELYVYTSLKKRISSDHKGLTLIWKYDNFSYQESIDKTFNVSIPKKTRNNGTLYTHVFLLPKGASFKDDQLLYYQNSVITTYAYPQAQSFNLLGEEKSETDHSKDKMFAHWRSKLTINVMGQDISFDRANIPWDISRKIKLAPNGDYLPILYIDELNYRTKDQMLLNSTSVEMPLTISYSPISVGKLRLWSHLQESIDMLHGLGFTEKDTDEVKGIFADTNFYFLLMTFVVAAFHLLFDFLAFKNEISYWKNRNSMEGLSTRATVWRCISTIIIFFYLMDEKTSLLVLIPAGVGTLIEVWKVSKAFKVKIVWEGWRPRFVLGEISIREKETRQFDSQAMKYLSYVLYPLCFCGAVYSLLYTPHKSWYSWCVKSLVNGVYAFGFLFMLPQLFVNYKLKSVAHLPWRAFMYKAFNTFIDDVFAFIITMPTAHRLACFRDDLVFLVYLYQRWLYPVDKTRVNEYGQSFVEDVDISETKKTR